MRSRGQLQQYVSKPVLMIGFILLYFIAALVNLDYAPLNAEEPRRAIIAIEMNESGNYFHPTTMGWEYYNKPPVYNWIIAGFMKMMGASSEMPVRLPSLVFLILWAISNYYFVRKLISEDAALLSSLFLLTGIEIYFWGLSNGGEIDIFYSFIVYLQALSIFYFNEKKSWTALYVVSFFLCAVGLLTKGFPSFLFQGFTLIALCVCNKSLRVLFKWQMLLGIGVMTAVVGGYLYIYTFYGNLDRLVANLLKESFNKSALGQYPEKFVKESIKYPVSFLKILLPWSLILLLLLKKHTYNIWHSRLVKFSALFILFNIPVYWFTGYPKMRYVYMFIAFSMIILAYILEKTRDEHPLLIKKIFRVAGLTFTLVVAGMIAAPFFLSLNYAWLGFLLVVFVAFLLFYYRSKANLIYYFGLGIVLLRLVYSVLFIPVRYEKMKVNYDKELAAMARLNNFQPVSIYKKPDQLEMKINLKVTQLDFGVYPDIPYIAYQMPYYYYRHTGHIVTYDTVLQTGKNFIGYKSTLADKKINVLYSFHDKNQQNDDIILFNLVP